MTRILMAALLATGMGVGTAAADAIVVYDKDLKEEFAAKRDIVEMVKQKYGQTAVYESGQQIPARIESNLVPGQMLPEGATTSAVPADLEGNLPNTEPGTSWVRVGEHLLELKPDGMIVMGVYEVLPAS